MMLINGREQGHIAAADRGLHYGDGLFETIAVIDGQLRLWDRHWQRLATGCQRLGITGVDHDVLRGEAHEVCNGVGRGVLKIIVTRGVGGRGYRPPRDAETTRIVAIYPWPDYPETYWRQGVAMRTCTIRLGHNTALAGLKHLNRLEQVLARREWDDADIAEGVMLDVDDNVIAGTMTNLFLVESGRLLTPALTQCGVAGVMRGLIRAIAAQAGVTCRETTVSLQGLLQADEVFVTNALAGIWPVRRIDQQEYALGPLTKLLGEQLRGGLAGRS